MFFASTKCLHLNNPLSNSYKSSMVYALRSRKEIGDLTEYHLWLFNDLLVIASQPRLTPLRTQIYQAVTGEQDYRFRAKIELASVVAIDQIQDRYHSGRFVFSIQVRNREPDMFYVNTQEEAKTWIKHLRHCLDETRRKRNTLRCTSKAPFAMLTIRTRRRHSQTHVGFLAL